MIAFHLDFTVFIILQRREMVISGRVEFQGMKKPSRNFGRAGRFLDSLGQEVPSEGVGGEDGGAHVLG